MIYGPYDPHEDVSGMRQDLYEAKKALLKRIQAEWSRRLTDIRKGKYTGSLSYGELVGYYLAARKKSRVFRGFE